MSLNSLSRQDLCIVQLIIFVVVCWLIYRIVFYFINRRQDMVNKAAFEQFKINVARHQQKIRDAEDAYAEYVASGRQAASIKTEMDEWKMKNGYEID